jgi:hypothetical protein
VDSESWPRFRHHLRLLLSRLHETSFTRPFQHHRLMSRADGTARLKELGILNMADGADERMGSSEKLECTALPAHESRAHADILAAQIKSADMVRIHARYCHEGSLLTRLLRARICSKKPSKLVRRAVSCASLIRRVADHMTAQEAMQKYTVEKARSRPWLWSRAAQMLTGSNAGDRTPHQANSRRCSPQI